MQKATTFAGKLNAQKCRLNHPNRTIDGFICPQFSAHTRLCGATFCTAPAQSPTYRFLKKISLPTGNLRWDYLKGETTFKNIILKWTHLDFGGGKLGTSPVSFSANGANAYTLTSKNSDGIVVLEDSWVYGCIDDQLYAPSGGTHQYQLWRNRDYPAKC